MSKLNYWNKIRYSIYAPVYDWVIAILDKPRVLSHSQADIKEGEKVLISGCGTGQDLYYIPKDCAIEAMDITPLMVSKTKKLATKLDMKVNCTVMDSGKLDYPDESFDVVLLHLIIAVIPDPDACLAEAKRVLKPGGRISIFDKFLGQHKQASLLRRVSGFITDLLFSNINRQIEPLLAKQKLEVVSDVPVFANGFFRSIIVKKNASNY
ncbi:MAG: class I SAM-dependent methyltransferase [bacterium]